MFDGNPGTGRSPRQAGALVRDEDQATGRVVVELRNLDGPGVDLWRQSLIA